MDRKSIDEAEQRLDQLFLECGSYMQDWVTIKLAIKKLRQKIEESPSAGHVCKPQPPPGMTLTEGLMPQRRQQVPYGFRRKPQPPPGMTLTEGLMPQRRRQVPYGFKRKPV